MNSIIESDINRIIVSNKLDWEKFKNKNILITGASGFLPSYIVEVLLMLNKLYNLNINVTALVRSKKNFKKRFAHHLANKNLTMLLQDVCTPISLDVHHHFIFHAASQASPKYYGKDPVGTLKANVIGAMNLLELSRSHPVESFLYFSSGEVYGEANIFPTNESDYGLVDPVTVRSCYAESKRMGENMCVAWTKQFNVPAKIVRPFHTYGPGISLDDGRVHADFVKNIVENKDIVMRSDGNAQRSFCYIADATGGFFKVLLEGENSLPYNVGNNKEVISIRDLAKTLSNIFPERNVNVIKKLNSDNNYLKSSIDKAIPDIGRIKDLGWNPSTNLNDGFKRTIESFLL